MRSTNDTATDLGSLTIIALPASSYAHLAQIAEKQGKHITEALQEAIEDWIRKGG